MQRKHSKLHKLFATPSRYLFSWLVEKDTLASLNLQHFKLRQSPKHTINEILHAINNCQDHV